MKLQLNKNQAKANINEKKIKIKLNNDNNKKISINEKQFKVNVKNNTVNVKLGIDRIYPELEDLEVIPTKEEQRFKSNKDGYNNVKVAPVTNDIDNNIISENIKKGVEILGVVGNYDNQKEEQEKTITPTKEIQEVLPDNEKTLSKVTVNPIPDEYIVPEGILDITKNGEYNVNNYAKVDVNTPVPKEEQSKSVTITENGTTTVRPDNNKVLSSVNITTDIETGIFPSGILDIIENGEYDVTNYEKANVNVEQSQSVYIQDIFVGTKTSLTYSIDFEPKIFIIKCNEQTQVIYDNLELSSKTNTFGLLGGFIIEPGVINGMPSNLPWFVWVKKTKTSTAPEIMARNVGYFMTTKYNTNTNKWDVTLGYEAGSQSFRMALGSGNLQIVFIR